MTKHIEAETITLRSGCGRHKLTMAATPTGVGIWIDGPEGRMLAINSVDNQPVAVEFYKLPYKGSMPALAISLDCDGRPVVQTADNVGGPDCVKMHDLFALLGVK